jgi:phage terminase Nu1 subunit (DNA packaging protein)
MKQIENMVIQERIYEPAFRQYYLKATFNANKKNRQNKHAHARTHTHTHTHLLWPVQKNQRPIKMFEAQGHLLFAEDVSFRFSVPNRHIANTWRHDTSKVQNQVQIGKGLK